MKIGPVDYFCTGYMTAVVLMYLGLYLTDNLGR